MFLLIAGVLIGFWLLRGGWKFYHAINWNEKPEPSPDLQAMHKRQAQLLHIQDVLTEAHAQGKLSQNVLDEFNVFCEGEIQGIEKIENDWKNRRESSKHAPS